ncbi:MAG TPA: alpha/beta hydrolase [Stellaceae bacterium]|nr:alpha/beta hydrolase [Stellaceae bacterium]
MPSNANQAAPGVILPPPRVEPYRGPPPHEKGPPVFLDYDQIELDAAYDQAVYQPNILQLNKRWASNSARVRARIGEPLRRAYGETAIEQLDIFRADAPNAPVFIFIHGGAWIRGEAKSYAAPAEMFLRAGAHYVVPDFINVGDAAGSLFPMAEQVCRAIAWIYRNAASFGGDSERIYLGGQSSGAHLAAVALTTHWHRAFGLPQGLIKGGLCTSGMYELAPVRLSARANYVKFTDEMVEQLSPIRHIDRLSAPLIVSYGTYETPEFIRQAREFAAAVRDAGKLRELIVAANYSHLELPETLCNPYGILGAAVLKMMGLGDS